MKLKRILAISLSLTMLFSMSLSSVAKGERTTPVEVPDEYNETAVAVNSDVKVVGNYYAVRVVNEGQSEGVTTSADIWGNVSLTNTGEATALDSSAYTEGTDIYVNGSVDAHTDNVEATAIHVRAGNMVMHRYRYTKTLRQPQTKVAQPACLFIQKILPFM